MPVEQEVAGGGVATSAARRSPRVPSPEQEAAELAPALAALGDPVRLRLLSVVAAEGRGV